MDVFEKYKYWIENLDEKDPLKAELLDIKDNEKEITDRFYQDIVFGTAGLRGICGAGTNRMNTLTVARATKGLGDYIVKSGEDIKRGVVFVYDCRYFSKEFSYLAAGILTAMGIKCFIFPSLRTTPELSFSIRALNAVSGVNMTASHNPKEYNGYKVYWKDGAQISGEVSEGILGEIEKYDLFTPFESVDLREAEEKGLLITLSEDLDRKYFEYVKSLSVRGDSETDRSVSVVYTPLNGAGSIPLSTIMKERGFENFVVVKEQKDPDPEFTTVPFPNPEDPRAFELAEKYARENDAELIIATDPDGDRMAVEVKDTEGNYVPLNGNQTGALLIDYMAEGLSEKGRLPEKFAMIKSIVTGEMGTAICEKHGIRVFEALTGFKNICGRIPGLEKEGYSCFFAYEESIGCAPGSEVRDKDGVSAGMLMAEMAAFYKKKGSSIYERLRELYEIYGYYCEDQVSLVLEGKDGRDRMERIMAYFRSFPFSSLGGANVFEIRDYRKGYKDIPPSDVLIIFMDDDSFFAVRPSGTEPKIKFYFYSVNHIEKEARRMVSFLKGAVKGYAEKVK